jgi:glycine dehydrogenase subunit 1
MRYIPHTDHDITAMLGAVGAESVEALFAHIPEELRSRATIQLPLGASETDTIAQLTALARANRTAPEMIAFLGAGAYAHFSPVVVDQIIQRSEFATAYTPYQPEVSQGTLQAIFEFQSLVATLLGLDVANASMYDGASATAEAVLMAKRILPQRATVLTLFSASEYRQVVNLSRRRS